MCNPGSIGQQWQSSQTDLLPPRQAARRKWQRVVIACMRSTFRMERKIRAIGGQVVRDVLYRVIASLL